LSIGRQVRMDVLVALFRQNAVIIGLDIVGVIALLDIPFMLSRISSVPNKG
jgi:hypothetical protein